MINNQQLVLSNKTSQMQIKMNKNYDNLFRQIQDIDDMQFMKHVQQSLITILNVLHQQNEQLRQTHKIQINRLNSIIREKQTYINQYKTVATPKIQKIASKAQTITPYKILLKSGKSQQSILNTQNIEAQAIHGFSIMEEASTPVSVTNLTKNRFSLQIGPSSGKKTCRISSSNIKNKIIKQKNQKIEGIYSPRCFVSQQNSQLLSILTFKDTNKQIGQLKQQKVLRNHYSSAHEKNTIDEINTINKIMQKNNEINMKIQCNTYKKQHNSKTKTDLLVSKKQIKNYNSNDLHKVKCMDIKIPVKIINISNSIKPR